jgi:hypothetical protein
MLDFYLLTDVSKNPDHPEQDFKDHVGSLDRQIFLRLKLKKTIPEEFYYDSDFRWDTRMIQQILHNIGDGYQCDGDLQSLVEILNIAKQRGVGLIAFCD